MPSCKSRAGTDQFLSLIYPNPLTVNDIDDLLRFTPEQKKQLASKLSGEGKASLSFVLTLIGRPSLLFLDEPTSAVDASTHASNFWEIVGHLRKRVWPSSYSSHYIEEVSTRLIEFLVLHRAI